MVTALRGDPIDRVKSSHAAAREVAKTLADRLSAVGHSIECRSKAAECLRALEYHLRLADEAAVAVDLSDYYAAIETIADRIIVRVKTIRTRQPWGSCGAVEELTDAEVVTPVITIRESCDPLPKRGTVTVDADGRDVACLYCLTKYADGQASYAIELA